MIGSTAPPARPSVGGRIALVLLVVTSGAAMSLQVFLSGRLGTGLGSFTYASTINTCIGALTLLAVLVGIGRARSTVEGLRVTPRSERWHWTVGVLGAYVAFITTYAAPRIGVAMVAVSLVCGQTAGGLLLDRIGVGATGPQPLTVLRLVGATLALAAVGLGAIGGAATFDPWLIAATVLAGAIITRQWVSFGRIAARLGGPIGAGIMNFVVAAAILLVIAVATQGVNPAGGWSGAPAWAWTAGLVSATVSVVVTVAVGRIGVFQLVLASVAGQMLGGVLIDTIAPASGSGVTEATVIGVVLAVAAVIVSNLRPSSSRQLPTPSVP